MKYRLLNDDELKELEKEFINFLVVNTVTADDWVRMKEQEPHRAFSYIEQFSDLVMENVLQKINYLEHRSPDNIMLFNFGDTEVDLISLTVADSSIDLTNNEAIQKLSSKPELISDNTLQIFRTKKYYQKERETEIFAMVEKGCLISDGKLFELVRNLAPGPSPEGEGSVYNR